MPEDTKKSPKSKGPPLYGSAASPHRVMTPEAKKQVAELSIDGFTEGTRVMVGGDLGTVRQLDIGKKSLLIRFDGRPAKKHSWYSVRAVQKVP